MKYYNSKENAVEQYSGGGHGSYLLLDESNGCENQCATGISYYKSTEYTEKAYHDFQEGFYVISGTGMAAVGEQEFSIREGMTFIVPKHTAHQLKAEKRDVPLYVFWFHAK